MSRITVIGGTGYAGSAIAKEAAARGHDVTSFSRSQPQQPLPAVVYVEGQATDQEALSACIAGADFVVSALAPREGLADNYREVIRAIARLTDQHGGSLYVVGGYSSLRPAPGAKRFVTDLSTFPPELRRGIRTGAALITEDLPATPDTLDWVFVSPAQKFGAWLPGEDLGRYRLGDDVAVDPDTGGEISAADFALGFLDLIESGEHHRAHLNLAH